MIVRQRLALTTERHRPKRSRQRLTARARGSGGPLAPGPSHVARPPDVGLDQAIYGPVVAFHARVSPTRIPTTAVWGCDGQDLAWRVVAASNPGRRRSWAASG